MKVLLITVGGSDVPVVTSINHHRADEVVFLCTESSPGVVGSRKTIDGEGLVCKNTRRADEKGSTAEDRPSITKQTGLNPEQYKIIPVEPDNPYDSYNKVYGVIENSLKDGKDVIVDYTGGTKSMSVGLAAAGMEFPQTKICIVRGPRTDLIKVKDGLQRVARLKSNDAFIQRQKEICRKLLSEWNYLGAVRVLEGLIDHCDDEQEKWLDRTFYLCKAFAAWDKFAYAEAEGAIELYKKEKTVLEYNKSLKRILSILNWYEQWNPDVRGGPPVFGLVYDVLLNAERRAAQGNFDDAISRIYRALEMYAQFCLRTGNPPLTSEDIDINALPADVRQIYEGKRGNKGKIKIVLTEDYDLLAYLNHPVGVVWQKWRSTILEKALKKRNLSFLAHGIFPLKMKDFEKAYGLVKGFIQECDIANGIKDGLANTAQLPKELWEQKT